ncbi:MFS transporter [Streptomyces sp. LS1784]|uniref:MFS transporter n=1 Tax=Streptomyces sp. LS1784 TaxID=2851533 RepID=UPI001CCAEFD2|nr:MFS transporter [Streptomyces sp. LS1784]
MTTAPPCSPAQSAAARRTTYREVLAEPRFRLLFVTRVVGVTAGSLRITTFSVLVFTGTGSALLSALAFGAGFLPQLFGSLLFGSLADRLPPRALIVGGFLVEGAAAALLALVRLPTAAGLALVALVALATPVFSGASARLVARWLSGDAYVLGRSLNNLASSGAQLFGLALGGAVVEALGPRQALAIGAALNLVCAAAVRLRMPRVPVEREEKGDASGHTGGGAVRNSLRGGTTLLRDRAVRRLLLAQWLPSAFVAGAEGLIVAYTGAHGFPAGSYAILLAGLPVGMLLGDLLVGRLLRPSTRERLVVPLIALMGAPLIGFAAEPGRLLAAVLLLCSGCGFAYGLGLQREFLAALPERGQGQAFGLLGSGHMTLQGVGPVCFGAITAASGTGGAMALAGVGSLLTAAWVLTWRRARPTAGPTA